MPMKWLNKARVTSYFMVKYLSNLPVSGDLRKIWNREEKVAWREGKNGTANNGAKAYDI